MHAGGSAERSPREHDEDAGDGGPSLLGILRLGWGIVAIAGLAGYSFVHTLAADQPSPRVLGSATAARAPAARGQPVYIGGKAFYPSVVPDTPLVVHLACNQEDARIARIYDPPPNGSAVILRIDQSPSEMRALYRGDDLQFPRDARLIPTPCMQTLIDSSEFP